MTPRSAAAIICAAFAGDPTWQPVLTPDGVCTEQARSYWSFLVTSASRYRHVYEAPGGGAVAVWYPPNSERMTESERAQFPDLVLHLLGEERSALLFATLDVLNRARPSVDHYYLSVLAVDPAHRGRGLGMALLRANLAQFDETGVPTYLVSSNPRNDTKYEALGFERYQTLTTPTGLATNTYLRPPGRG